MLQPTDERRYIYMLLLVKERERCGEIPDGGEMAHRIIVWKQYQKHCYHTDNILVNIHTNKNQHTTRRSKERWW